MPEIYDAVVIGTGPAGYVSAIRTAQHGKKVIAIENKYIGGTCLNVGCIPTKALLHAGEFLKSVKISKRMGIEINSCKVNFPSLQSWKERTVKKLTRGIEILFAANGVEYIFGKAVILSDKKVIIEKKNGEVKKVEGKNIVIATGSAPLPLKGFEFDKEYILSSDDALFLERLPENIIIIGAGFIGLEFAGIFNSFGSRVQVVEIMEQVLPGTDTEIANTIMRSFQKEGIKIYLKARAKEVIKENNKLKVTIIKEDGKEEILEGDKILVCVGRKPLTDEVGLESVGVSTDNKGFINVNNKLETNIHSIYAIGDCARPPLLAHKGMKEGIIVADRIKGEDAVFDNFVPSCIFTDPEISSCGMTEEEVKKRGIDYVVGKFPFSASAKAVIKGKQEGFIKIIAEREKKKILGVHIIGPEASSLIGEAVIALEMSATLEDVALSLHPHPTLTESFAEACEDALFKPIHFLGK